MGHSNLRATRELSGCSPTTKKAVSPKLKEKRGFAGSGLTSDPRWGRVERMQHPSDAIISTREMSSLSGAMFDKNGDESGEILSGFRSFKKGPDCRERAFELPPRCTLGHRRRGGTPVSERARAQARIGSVDEGVERRSHSPGDRRRNHIHCRYRSGITFDPSRAACYLDPTRIKREMAVVGLKSYEFLELTARRDCVLYGKTWPERACRCADLRDAFGWLLPPRAKWEPADRGSDMSVLSSRPRCFATNCDDRARNRLFIGRPLAALMMR